MSDKFERPVDLLNRQDMYQEREVGITHPDTSAYVKLNDLGDIDMTSTDGLGIYLHKQTKSLVIMADNIKLMTKDNEGLRWNQNHFNAKATSFNEPTLIYKPPEDIRHIYKGTENFFPTDNEVVDPTVQQDYDNIAEKLK